MTFWLHLLSMPLSILCWGWCTCVAWAWFAPVVSPMIPVLTLGQCVALRCLVNYFHPTPRWRPNATPEQSKDIAIHYAVCATVVPFVMLGCGWIIHLFIHAPAILESAHA